MMPGFMTIEQAMEIVLELAQQNIVDQRDMPDEHARQHEAWDTVHDFYLNNIVN